MSLYQQIAVRPDFQEFILDLIERMGISETHLQMLFPPVTGSPEQRKRREKNFQEFAKCFVAKYADPHYNYEVYELAGDACINNAVIMYLLKQIIAAQDKTIKQDPTFKPSPQTTDYYNKLKAFYISLKEFHDIATRLGFNEFLVIGTIPANKENVEPDKILTDCFEAFIGCFEVLGDRFLDSHYSHQYVSNFVNYLFSMRKINYDPVNCYDFVTLFKETNDKLRKAFSCEYKLDYNQGTDSTSLYFIPNSKQRDVKRWVQAFPSRHGTLKSNSINMSEEALTYVRQIADRSRTLDPSAVDAVVQQYANRGEFTMNEIVMPPTMKSLGIESLA